MSLPNVPNVVSTEELIETAEAIIDWQLPNGMIPWFPGGHCDPWNHIEAAMALACTGHLDEAESAYEWLLHTQHESGAGAGGWHQYYLSDGIEDTKFDANVIAYIATGVWHHWLMTRDRGFLERMWSSVDQAIEFVLCLQTSSGPILWARHEDGTPWSYALLTGSSSICHSLRCAIAIGEELGHDRPDWELSLAHLAHAIRTKPEGAFAPKERWAMDWYYPVLSGALDKKDTLSHLEAQREKFIIEGYGVRCVSDQDWVTAAETCECAMAYLIAGDRTSALELFQGALEMRQEDGRCLTGLVQPDHISFPENECTTYTAAAIILAADAISGSSPASSLFVDHSSLPDIIDTESVVKEKD